MKSRQRICARQGTVQHKTKVFYFVALKFAGLPDHHILTNCDHHKENMHGRCSSSREFFLELPMSVFFYIGSYILNVDIEDITRRREDMTFIFEW
jgi:hypothetical protein